MDEELRNLQREYRSSGDRAIGARMVSAAIRAADLPGQVTNYLVNHPPSYGYVDDESRDWDAEETIYSSWDSETNRVCIVIAAYVFYTYTELQNNYPPPEPQMHFSSEWGRREYEDRWGSHENQSRGFVNLLSFVFQLLPDLSWEGPTLHFLHRHDIHKNTISNTMFKNYIFGNAENPPNVVVLVDNLAREHDLTDKLETPDSFPELIDEFGGSCEDFPACGHSAGQCPQMWSTGQQAEILCVCGASLPPNSRFSICDSCLRQPMEGDDPYDSPFYDDRDYYDDDIYDDDDD